MKIKIVSAWALFIVFLPSAQAQTNGFDNLYKQATDNVY